MDCKICNNNLKSSVKIAGLMYCNACNKFYYTGVAVNPKLTFEEVLKELVIISGASSILQNPRCANIVLDLVDIDVIIQKAYVDIIRTYPNLYLELNNAQEEGNIPDAINHLVFSICKSNNTSHRLIKYIIEICAYAVGLMDYVEPYEEKDDSTFKIERFESDKNYIKSKESITISWNVTGNAILKVILNDGRKDITVEKSGQKIVNPIGDTIYTLRVSSEHFSDEHKLTVKILRRPLYTKWWFWAILGVVVAYLAVEIIGSYYTSVQKTKVLTESSINVEKIIPGLYTVKQSFNGKETPVKLNSEIRLESIGIYAMIIVSEFEPEIHRFKVLENNKLYSETLGEGEILYKENIDRTTIIFKKGEIQWELKK